VIDAFWRRQPAHDEVRTFADALVRGVKAHQPKIDELIARFAEHWELDRMAVVDRNLLRAGIWELLWGADVPPKVAINEALEIARRFSTEESTRFVNGLLDRVRRESARRPAVLTGAGPAAAHDPSPPSRRGDSQSRRSRASPCTSGFRDLGGTSCWWPRAGAGLAVTGNPGRRLEGRTVWRFPAALRWLTHTMTTFSTMTAPVALVLLALVGTWPFSGAAWRGPRLARVDRSPGAVAALVGGAELPRTYLSGFPGLPSRPGAPRHPDRGLDRRARVSALGACEHCARLGQA
jgi:N utilization substance protein B